MAGWKVRSSFKVNGFFYFSHSQRIVILALVVGCILVGFLLRYFSAGNDSSALEGEWIEVADLEKFSAQQNVALPYSTPKQINSYNHSTYLRHRKNDVALSKVKLFEFDPNTISLDKLQQLGLSERTAMNVINYREKGGRFRKPEDLKKLYSLKPEDAQRLMPFVKISETQTQAQQSAANKDVHGNKKAANNTFELVATTNPKSESRGRLVIERIDINLADSFSLTLLPGIGAKRAGAICRYRDRLGGFATFEQIAETYGLPDSVFQNILPYITLGNGPSKKICLNTATETQLKSHPYIGWQMAKIIVAYRNQHGNFKTIEDLSKIYAVKKDWLEKVKPFLKVES